MYLIANWEMFLSANQAGSNPDKILEHINGVYRTVYIIIWMMEWQPASWVL